MPFFARPDLGDEQFKQLVGTELTLSGQTRIASVTGLTLTDGSGGYIPIIATGATNLDVLTYDGSTCQIVLMPQSGGGSGVYSGASPTTTTVGGLCSGSAIAGCSITNILQSILVPAIPLTTSLSIATGGASRQYGDCSVGNLCYSVIKNTNIITAISASTCGNGVYNCNIPAGTGGTCTGTVPYTYSFSCAVPAVKVKSSSVSFNLCAKTCTNECSTATAAITWMDTKYWGGKNINLTTCAIVSGTTVNSSVNTLGNCQLSSTGNWCCSNFNVGSNNYFYYAYPKIFGLPQQITINGLPNNAWGCACGTVSTLRRCNTNGYCQDFYLIRSDSQISGCFSINIITVC